jgi:hypothetical protein
MFNAGTNGTPFIVSPSKMRFYLLNDGFIVKALAGKMHTRTGKIKLWQTQNCSWGRASTGGARRRREVSAEYPFKSEA